MGKLTVGFAWRGAGSEAQPFFPEEEPAPSEEPTEDSAGPHRTPHSSALFVIIFNQIVLTTAAHILKYLTKSSLK